MLENRGMRPGPSSVDRRSVAASPSIDGPMAHSAEPFLRLLGRTRGLRRGHQNATPRPHRSTPWWPSPAGSRSVRLARPPAADSPSTDLRTIRSHIPKSLTPTFRSAPWRNRSRAAANFPHTPCRVRPAQHPPPRLAPRLSSTAFWNGARRRPLHLLAMRFCRLGPSKTRSVRPVRPTDTCATSSTPACVAGA
jgi:hypothetical protein